MGWARLKCPVPWVCRTLGRRGPRCLELRGSRWRNQKHPLGRVTGPLGEGGNLLPLSFGEGLYTITFRELQGLSWC